MSDVMTKVINANSIYNGNAVTAVNKQGDYDVVSPAFNKAPQPSAVRADLDSRFDDRTYYSN